jgi:hypothetical protein
MSSERTGTVAVGSVAIGIVEIRAVTGIGLADAECAVSATAKPRKAVRVVRFMGILLFRDGAS